jgi:HPt (histidine-containing phosphotransfer) domain-containing protein
MHLNIQDIRDYTGADDVFIVKLFDKFLEHINNDIAKLKKETEAQNWNAVKAVSHQMLSSARIFSLKQMAVLHEQIEKDCINNTTDKVPEMVVEMVELYEEAILEIKALKNTL